MDLAIEIAQKTMTFQIYEEICPVLDWFIEAEKNYWAIFWHFSDLSDQKKYILRLFSQKSYKTKLIMTFQNMFLKLQPIFFEKFGPFLKVVRAKFSLYHFSGPGNPVPLLLTALVNI